MKPINEVIEKPEQVEIGSDYEEYMERMRLAEQEYQDAHKPKPSPFISEGEISLEELSRLYQNERDCGRASGPSPFISEGEIDIDDIIKMQENAMKDMAFKERIVYKLKFKLFMMRRAILNILSVLFVRDGYKTRYRDYFIKEIGILGYSVLFSFVIVFVVPILIFIIHHLWKHIPIDMLDLALNITFMGPEQNGYMSHCFIMAILLSPIFFILAEILLDGYTKGYRIFINNIMKNIRYGVIMASTPIGILIPLFTIFIAVFINLAYIITTLTIVTIIAPASIIYLFVMMIIEFIIRGIPLIFRIIATSVFWFLSLCFVYDFLERTRMIGLLDLLK